MRVSHGRFSKVTYTWYVVLVCRCYAVAQGQRNTCCSQPLNQPYLSRKLVSCLLPCEGHFAAGRPRAFTILFPPLLPKSHYVYHLLRCIVVRWSIVSDTALCPRPCYACLPPDNNAEAHITPARFIGGQAGYSIKRVLRDNEGMVRTWNCSVFCAVPWGVVSGESPAILAACLCRRSFWLRDQYVMIFDSIA